MRWECSECGGVATAGRRPVTCGECGTAGVIFTEVGMGGDGGDDNESFRDAWLRAGFQLAAGAAAGQPAWI